MPRNQSFAFDLHDKVTILAINRPGIVTAMSVDELGAQYRVVFWNDCARRTEWVYDHEIALRKEPDA